MDASRAADNRRPVVTVFGSSTPHPGDDEYRLALALGRELARQGFTICNGGYGGTMEASARGAQEAGGAAIGVTVPLFSRNPNRYLDRIIERTTLFERITTLIETGDAYVVLRGSTGTLLEFAAVWELLNKKLMEEKPLMLLGPFWTGVLDLLRDEALPGRPGKITSLVRVVSSPEECAGYLRKRLILNG